MTRKELLEALKEDDDGGMVGILPSVVLLDEKLSMSARLLYALITWRAGKKSYTWRSNKELGEDIGLTAKRVSELVQNLAEQGHIVLETERDEETGEILRRLIYPVVKSGQCIPKKTDRVSRKKRIGYPEDSGEGIPKKTEVICNKNKVKGKDTPPTPPAGGRKGRRQKEPPEPDWLPERFEGFWGFYPRDYRGNKQRARTAWNRLKPDKTTLRAIANAIKRHKAGGRWREGIGIPNASTFLNPANGYWELSDAKASPTEDEALGGSDQTPPGLVRSDLPVWS